MSVSPFWQVAWREVRERGRSRAYLITSAVTFLIVLGLVLAPRLIGAETDEIDLGVVGTDNESIVEVAEQLANAGGNPEDDPSVVITTTTFTDRQEAEAALAAGEIEAILLDGRELVIERSPAFGGSSLLGLLQRGAATVELERIVAERGQAAADVIEVMTSDPLEVTTLSGEDPEDPSGSVVAYAGLILLYAAILLYGSWILTGVTEEKSNRVVEVLLSSLRPWQLLGGKIIGIGILGISQFVATIVIALIALRLSGTFELPQIGAPAIASLIVWFVLGFLLYAVLFGAAASLVSRTEEAQNVAFPMTLLAVVGFFVALEALDDPDGAAAVIGTFVPLTSPFVVPVRASLEALPPWHHALAIAGILVTIVGMVLVGGRIYSGGLLRFGKRIRLREAWRNASM